MNTEKKSLRAWVGAAGWFCGLLIPKVVKAVELSENMTTNTANSSVKFPHCVYLVNDFCIFILVP